MSHKLETKTENVGNGWKRLTHKFGVPIDGEFVKKRYKNKGLYQTHSFSVYIKGSEIVENQPKESIIDKELDPIHTIVFNIEKEGKLVDRRSFSFRAPLNIAVSDWFLGFLTEFVAFSHEGARDIELRQGGQHPFHIKTLNTNGPKSNGGESHSDKPSI